MPEKNSKKIPISSDSHWLCGSSEVIENKKKLIE